ncbi:hypothetical protein L208DRAFT_1385462 [Tricholoma matsutake]|nr:hypothetical protein L208DRAFT_1385462 [Tricholoma matsutake 945]
MLPFMLLLLALFVLSPTSGAAVSLSLSPFNSLHQLHSRQTSTLNPSTIPAQCQSRCNLVTTTVTGCQNSTNPTCGCSMGVEAGFVDCLNCLISLAPSQTLVSSEQQYVDQFVQVCNSYGVALPSTTLSSVVSSASGTGLTSSTNVANRTTITSLASSTTAPSSSNGTSTSPASTAAPLSSSPTSTRSAAWRGTRNAKESVIFAVLAAAAFTILL